MTRSDYFDSYGESPEDFVDETEGSWAENEAKAIGERYW